MGGEPIESLARLKEQFQKLPGIGPRSAERLAFHVLREPRKFAAGLAQAILDVKDKIIHCRTCYNLTEADPCAICADATRDRGTIWVVEQPKDLVALEATGLIRGTYHVLMGHIAPLDGIAPEDLTIADLEARVKSGQVEEVILATNPTVAGDSTNLYIAECLKPLGVKITRLARGLPAGGQIEYANRSILSDAINERREL